MPTIVGILTFISMINYNTISERLKARNFFISRYFSFYEQLKFYNQLSWAWNMFYNLGTWSLLASRVGHCSLLSISPTLTSVEPPPAGPAPSSHCTFSTRCIWVLQYGLQPPKRCCILQFTAYQSLVCFLSFSIYCQTLFRVLSAGVFSTRVAGWKPTSNHILITVGFFNLHRGWLDLHRGHPVNVPIRRTMHLSSVIPANDTRESVFGHRNFLAASGNRTRDL